MPAEQDGAINRLVAVIPTDTVDTCHRAQPDRSSAVHDLTAARIWGVVRELAAARLVTLVGKGYIGAGEPVCTPYRGGKKAANRARARLRALGERANAQLKCWHILRKLRCCPWRVGQLAKAIRVLQAREIGG